jgi:deoxyribodipyrimidine photo-lyase
VKKQQINMVWFKRDLRLQDHKPMQKAVAAGLPILLLYIYEPSILAYPTTDERHTRFIQESITDLNTSLKKFNHTIYQIHEEVIDTLEKLSVEFEIKQIYSHQEIGNGFTFKRDKAVKKYCNVSKIIWNEYPTNAIRRGLKDRADFAQHWHTTMLTPIFEVDYTKLKSIVLPNNIVSTYNIIHKKNNAFQPGGVTFAEKYLQSFLTERKNNYSKHISKPEQSRKSCSRISPYLAWGNLSMKQVYQASLVAKKLTGDKHNIDFFTSRLHWHCHFIQKFESECRMEYQNLNAGFNDIRNHVDDNLLQAWQQGQTGYPLIDACIICVTKTGYLNFRMRSMVVSFLTHHLWQPWQAGTYFLAKQFLDYEPGIHYPQFQMQAGTMGVHTIRIYNPIKQGQDHDPDGSFVKNWLPILQHVPSEHIHQPWLMTMAEQLMYKVEIGKDYPAPIVDATIAARFARENLWKTKKTPTTKKQAVKILKKHTHRKTVQENILNFKA